MAFECGQPGDFADDKGFRANPSLARRAGSLTAFKNGSTVEAAENAGEHFRPADPGGQVKPGHGLGGTDEMRGGPGGVTFGGGKEPVGRADLKRAKGGAVNVVDDDRHARAPGREPAEDSRLAAVGVDDVGLLFAQDFFKLPQREPVFQRMNRTDEFRNARENFRRAREFGFQRTFRAGRRAGDANGLRRRVSGAGRARRRRCFPARRRRPAG